MKKISIYILAFIIFANLLTPFGVALNIENNPTVKKLVAEAGDMTINISQQETAQNSTKVVFEITRTETDHHEFVYLLTDKDGVTIPDSEKIATLVGFGSSDFLTPKYFKEPTGAKRLSEDNISLNSPFHPTGGGAYTKDNRVVGNLSPNTTYYLYYIGYSGNTPGDIKTGMVLIKTNNDPPVNVDAEHSSTTADGTYTLLAPLPGLTEIKSDGIGNYLNIIFKIAIGLCGALAVIMIVIGGIQYMGTDSVFGKTEAKGKILSAILGLFIALGAFAILNTINPDLTGQKGLVLDQVQVDTVRDRADDPDFVSNIDSFDISNITVNPSDYSDSTFLGYLSHQQGVAGASAILWSAKKGYNNVPSNNPFAKGDINRNMSTNFPVSSAQKTIGTSTLTPANFLKYWAIKVAAAKKKTSPQIPALIDNELVKVANETGVGIVELRTMCRIESLKGCTDATSNPSSITKVNSFGYSGLFQLSKAVFEKYKKSSGTILNAYDNSFAAAQFFKVNLNGINSKWAKINS